MKAIHLLKKAESEFLQDPEMLDNIFSAGIFSSGALWMSRKLNGASALPLNNSWKFSFYGFAKYFFCALALLISAVFLFSIHPALCLLSVPLFYFFEVHFLFLFPIMIEGLRYPVAKSIAITYQTGILNCMFNVMIIAFYMLKGLFNFSQPLRNWYIGCLAVVIWYRDEIRNRI